MKRLDYISWDEFFMGVAVLAAQRSKDPNTQVGACLVNDKNRIIGVGYNGFPNGCSDDELPWGSVGKPLDIKYLYVVHAEQNCLTNSTSCTDNSTIYVTLFPCNECAKQIIQSGVKEVCYLEDKYHDRDLTIAARKMFDLSGVKYRQFIAEEKND